MAAADDPGGPYSTLRVLVVADPRAAGRIFSEMLDSGGPALKEFLERVSAPGEGRLRQLVANTVRQREKKDRAVPFLLGWLDFEADEFTRRAIEAALEGVDRASHGSRAPQSEPMALVDTYRYVADRLCHRVRNSLVGIAPLLSTLGARVRETAPGASHDDMVTALSGLREGLQRLNRVVEFDVDDDHFAWRAIPLVDWLKQMNNRYVATYDSVNLTIRDEIVAARPVVRATDFLLETLFWNLWKNAQQAAPERCGITIRGRCANAVVLLDILDTGPGLTAHEAENVFQGVFSTKGTGRGRGLLEAHDAARRLQGSIAVYRQAENEFRFRVSLPEDR